MSDVFIPFKGSRQFTIDAAGEGGGVDTSFHPVNELFGNINELHTQGDNISFNGIKSFFKIHFDQDNHIFGLGVVDALSDLLNNLDIVVNPLILNKCVLFNVDSIW